PLLKEGHDLLRKIEKLSKPVIMAINGFALGGGCEIAMAGDIRIAADNARIGLPEINLGLLPGYGGTQRMPRIVGKGMAKMLILTGDHIDAQEALRIGLVEKVVPAAELMDTARALAKKMAGKAPLALEAGKKMINVGMECDLDQALEYELALGTTVFFSEDRLEGTTAFLEKRKPVWKGR
ncbi:MAG: enoyl-CoA hydratase-related protein, partial [Chloroflexi bacterium]|nr:enoyl-CoA hydratase-related protein [Chloroflexota bacterium]